MTDIELTDIERLILENQYAIMRILRSDYLRWSRDQVGLEEARKRVDELGINAQCKKTSDLLELDH